MVSRDIYIQLSVSLSVYGWIVYHILLWDLGLRDCKIVETRLSFVLDLVIAFRFTVLIHIKIGNNINM